MEFRTLVVIQRLGRHGNNHVGEGLQTLAQSSSGSKDPDLQLDSLTDERLTTDEGPVPVHNWLPECTYAHEEEHCADILAWRRSIETSET